MVVIKNNTQIRRELREELQEQMQSLLLASITHDLRTPLNSVFAMNDALAPFLKNSTLGMNYLKVQRNNCVLMMNTV